jgi:outer membrane protein OmpA-like peptidoglycan-associated protein
MRCQACGYENAANAAFCGQCGKALSGPSAPDPSHNPVPQAPPPTRKWGVGIGIVGACLVAAAVAIGLIRHPPGTRGTSSSTAGATSGLAAATPAGAAPENVAPAPTAEMSKSTVSTVVPSGANIAALATGGEIESINDAYGPGHLGRLLLDGSPATVWTPDGDNVYPHDVVFSFYKRDTALVSALVLNPASDGWGPKMVEVWTATDSANGAFTKAAVADVTDTLPVQAIAFTPVLARYVKLRIDSGPDPALKIGEVQIIEGTRPGYTTMLARHPEIAKWKTSVRYAAQAGIDWLEPASMDWQRDSRCFGCHVQAQTLMGLSVAQSNNYVVSGRAAHDLAEFTGSKQDTDGHEIDAGADTRFTPTQFAAMGLAYYDEARGAKTDSALRRYVHWLAEHAKPTGEVPQDMEEPPIAQGSLMGTANAVVAFMEAFAQTSDSSYKVAADRGLAFIAATKPVTTQDKIFTIIALSRYGTPEQRDVASKVIQQLQLEQDRDGGWREKPSLRASNAFATGQVLYAFKEGGVSIESPTFSNGVRYLIATQQRSGSWPPGETETRRPSEFAPTMWAVIGLAGAIEPPTAESMKLDLDKYGRVRLYINFDFNKATIRPDAKPIIGEVVKLLKGNPDLALQVNGNTDNVGTHDYNVELSQRRAAAVVDALVAAHIARDRLTAGGFGPDQPIADNDTEKGRALNRRVELVKP